MPTVMNMPKIGVNMTDAKITEWVVKEGDTIKEGDHILDAETDKAVQEIYATMSGVIAKILTPAGTDVLCRSPIAVLVEPGEKLDDEFLKKFTGYTSDGNKNEKEKVEKKPVQEIPVSTLTATAEIVSGRKRISPLAKKIAKNMGIALAELQPSRPGARIVKADILAYVPRRTSSNTTALGPAGDVKDTISYTGIRKLIGDRMTESKQTKPSVALTLHTNVEKLIEWRDKLKKAGKAVSYNDMMVMIAAKALKEQPIINSKLAGSEIQLLQDIHVGVAVDTEKGLAVPVIKNADKKGLLEISEDFRKKVEAVKSGRAGVEDLTGGTFTITNLGMFEIENFTPIINPPECCILALGSIIREPVVGENDIIEIKSRMQLTLVFDHRIVDGAPAAKFLQRVKHLVEWPMDLMS